MALVVPQYVYSVSTPGAPIVSALSIKHIPAQNPDNGLHLSIGNVAAPPAWPVAPTGQVIAGGPHDLGLYTLSQMQCVCIAVAIYPTPATPNWTQAGLVHVSSARHSAVQDIINTLTPANHTQAYVVIAAKHGAVGCRSARALRRRRFGSIQLLTRQPFRSAFRGMEPLDSSFNEGYGLDSILVAESSGRSLNQGYGRGAHLRSAMGAKLSVRSDLHMNLEYFHRTPILVNGFRPFT